MPEPEPQRPQLYRHPQRVRECVAFFLPAAVSILMTSWDKAFSPSNGYLSPGTAGMMKSLLFQPLLCVVAGVFALRPDGPNALMRVLLTFLATIVVGVVNLPLAFFVCWWVIRS